MNTTAPKLVLDTNILIASIGTRSPYRWIFDCVVDGRIILCLSNEILTEYEEVLTRKTNQLVAENIINLLTISPFTVRTDIYFNFGLIDTDHSDNKFVDCAIASNADLILSNDKHFQILETINFPKVRVLTADEFADIYKEELAAKG